MSTAPNGSVPIETRSDFQIGPTPPARRPSSVIGCKAEGVLIAFCFGYSWTE
jgi:hypothetical protein